MRTCTYPYCPTFAKEKSIYCEKHQSELKPRKLIPRKSLSPELLREYARKEWKELSRRLIEASPECSICENTEDLVLDHWKMSAKEMLETFGHFSMNPDYYRVLCRSCNSRRSHAIPLLPSLV